MKKVLSLLLFFVVFSTHAAIRFNVVTPGALNAAEIKIPLGEGKTISLLELSTISAKDYEKLAGKKMNFFNRLTFKMAQHKLAKCMDADGKITNKKLLKAFSNEDHSRGFHIGGFALGFFVGLIGVLIAYLIKDDYKKNRVKWSWIGFATWLVIYLLLILPALV